MFEALVFSAVAQVNEYETKGPGSTRSKQLEQAVKKAQVAVLSEDDHTFVMLSEFVFDNTNPVLKLSVVVPRYYDAYQDYVRALEQFSAVLQTQLHHPAEKITITLEDKPTY